MTQKTETSTQSYLENFKILSDIAAQMRSNTEIDIDQLVPLAERAIQAHKVCEARCQEVEKALGELIKTQASGEAK